MGPKKPMITMPTGQKIKNEEVSEDKKLSLGQVLAHVFEKAINV